MKERGEKFIAIERGRFSKIDSFVASERGGWWWWWW